MTDLMVQDAGAPEQPVYEFRLWDYDGRYALMLIDQQLEAAAKVGPTAAWFYWTTDHPAMLSKMAEWADQRRDRWQEWGAMARADHGAFYAHFARVLAAEPLPPVSWGYTLDQDPADKRRLILWELFAVPDHPPCAVAWDRHYRSAREADRAFRWLNAAENLPEWQAMAELAAEQGPSAVNDMVDRAVAAGRWC